MTRKRPVEDRDTERKLDTLDQIEAQARERIAGGQRASLDKKQKLNWDNKDPNFRYFWASDSETSTAKPQDLLFGGYEFERFENGPYRGEKVIERGRDGSNMYLMRIPMSLYNEAMQRAEQELSRKEADLLKLKENEYAGDSKEVGKGKTVSQKYVKEDGQSPLMGE